jgi:hypothetical protein
MNEDLPIPIDFWGGEFSFFSVCPTFDFFPFDLRSNEARNDFKPAYSNEFFITNHLLVLNDAHLNNKNYL